MKPFLQHPRPAWGYRILLVCVSACLPVMAMAETASASTPLVVQFDQPAEDWESQGLPIGNGAMGAVIAGGVARDIIQFNEKTLWSGGPGAEGYDFGWPAASRTAALAQARQTIAEQGSLAPEAAARLLGHKIAAYGDYQTFGELHLISEKIDSDVINYQRRLSLDNAQVDVTYTQAGVNYRREYLASYPDGVIAIRFSADQPGQISLTANLAVPDNRSLETRIESGRLIATGKLHSNGLQFETQIQFVNQGGELAQLDHQKIRVAKADSLVILINAGTDYAQQYPRYRAQHPHKKLQQAMNAASKKTLCTDSTRPSQGLPGAVSAREPGYRPAAVSTTYRCAVKKI